MKYRRHKYYTLDQSKGLFENLVEICKLTLPVEMAVEKLKNPDVFTNHFRKYDPPGININNLFIRPTTGNDGDAYSLHDFAKVGLFAYYNTSKLENNSIRVVETYLKRTIPIIWETVSITSIKDTYDKLRIDLDKKVIEESKKEKLNRSKLRRINTLRKNISKVGNKKQVVVSNTDVSFERFSLEVTDLTESQVEKINIEIAKILNEE